MNTVDDRRFERTGWPIDDGGSGLPNHCYTSDEWLRAERERLFARTWMLAGFQHDIPRPGDVQPVTVAGMPLLLLRDREGEVRCFHNVCRHRGTTLVDGPCRSLQALTCPYHAWSYALDGRLLTRPHFHGAGHHDVIEKGGDAPGLVTVRHALLHDLIFVNLSGDAPAFEDHVAFFLDKTAAYDLASLRYAATVSFEIAGNWKLVYENYIDCYHIFSAHPRLNNFADMSGREPLATHGHWLWTRYEFDAPEPGRGVGLPYYPGLEARWRHTCSAFHLFPTACFHIWPDQLALIHHRELSPGRTHEDIHLYFVGDAATDPAFADARESVAELWRELNGEDVGVIERMQQGRSSGGFDGGVLSPYWDRPTQHFARLVAKSVNGGA